jgi:hypothetical protein
MSLRKIKYATAPALGAMQAVLSELAMQRALGNFTAQLKTACIVLFIFPIRYAS